MLTVVCACPQIRKLKRDWPFPDDLQDFQCELLICLYHAGMLLLSLTKDTYEQLGVQGKASAYQPGMRFSELIYRYVKGEVRRKMNFTYVLGFVVLRDVVKVFPVSSSSFARKTTGGNRTRSHSGA